MKDIRIITKKHRHDFITKSRSTQKLGQTSEDLLDHKPDNKSYCYDTDSVDVLC